MATTSPTPWPAKHPTRVTNSSTSTTTASLVALRYNQWKLVFAEQRAHGFDVWQEPFVTLRVPKLFNLRSDPFEQADHIGMDYNHWRIERIFLLVPAQQYVGKFLATFKRISAQPESRQLLARQGNGKPPAERQQVTRAG